MSGSVFKLNHSRDPLEEAPIAGYSELRIARAGLSSAQLLVPLYAYVIYGVSESAERNREHVGATVFPGKEHLEQLIQEYTALEGIVVDSEFTLDGRRTPYIVVPLQYNGPYAARKPFSQARKGINPDLLYMRIGSRTATAGELERRKMASWETWFLDGRYVSSVADLEALIRSSVPGIVGIEGKGDYVRFQVLHTASDTFGKQKRFVLGHAYPGISDLSDSKLQLLQDDHLEGTHDRWLVCHRGHSSSNVLAERLAIRVLTIEDLFLVLSVVRTFLKELSELRDPSGRSLSFKDLLIELREKPLANERTVKATGLSPKDLASPFVYEPLFSDFTQRLPENVPDAATWRYVRAAAQYLKSYVDFKSGRRA